MRRTAGEKIEKGWERVGNICGRCFSFAEAKGVCVCVLKEGVVKMKVEGKAGLNYTD